MTEVHPLDANLISSEKGNGKHILMLDLDQPSYIVSSSSHAHNHVYIDADLDLEALKEIVDVLAKHGILQAGIKKQLDAAGCLTLRPPGVKKTSDEDQVGLEEYKKLKTPKKPIEVNIQPKFPGFSATNDQLIKDSFGIPQYIHSDWLQEAPMFYTEEPKAKISDFKTLMTGKKTSKYYEAEHAIKKGVYVMPVAHEGLSNFVMAMGLKLGIDSAKIEVVSTPDFSLSFNNYDENVGIIRYQGSKLASLGFSVTSMQYLVQFRREFIENEDLNKGGVPEGWPEWDSLVKAMSQL